MQEPSAFERIRVNGTTLAYRDEGIGEPLIFIHGSGSDLRTWDKQVDVFASRFRTIAYSRRFHAPNEPIPDEAEDYFDAHIDDLRGLIEELKIGPAHIVGHSWGGLIAMKFAYEHPSALKTLTLIEPPAISLHIDVPPTAMQFLRLLIRSPMLAVSLAKFFLTALGPSEAAFRKGDDEAAVAFFGKGVLGRESFDALSKDRYSQVWANRGPDRAQALFGTFPKFPADFSSNYRFPVLLIGGGKSPQFFRLLLNNLSTFIPDVRTIEIGGASHIVHEDASDEFNSQLMKFLEISTRSATRSIANKCR